MEIQTITSAAPIIIALGVILLLQLHIFASPADLEKKHREIIKEINKDFVTKENVGFIREKIENMDGKIDQIYNKLIGVKGND